MNTIEFKDIKFHIQHKTLFNSRSDGKFRIVEYEKSDKVTVVFEDTGYTKIVQMGSIRLGNIKDRLKPRYSGVGILGDKYGCQVLRLVQDLVTNNVKRFGTTKNLILVN